MKLIHLYTVKIMKIFEIDLFLTQKHSFSTKNKAIFVSKINMIQYVNLLIQALIIYMNESV